MAWKLCSKEDVISIHKYPIEDLKDLWSETVEALICQHMRTPHIGSSEIIINETHNGDGTYILLVDKMPIISVQAIRISGITSSASDYVVFRNHVTLIKQTFPIGIANVQIDYISGNLIINPVVRLTAIAMIAAIINYYGRYGADSSIKWAKGEQQEGESTPNLNVGLTSHLKQIMKRMLQKGKLHVG